ncbi:protein TAPETUM DETERMINANT 1-like [Argentina anserina]|uniref:protein TAPETUM DETERMINANT 1-like n=1 Tax=Argentina anserina TaxID=57926 RepID=UPI0021769546|nr:protein TAPETUM DETERMINANT 1-like [Potentilla anserina]
MRFAAAVIGTASLLVFGALVVVVLWSSPGFLKGGYGLIMESEAHDSVAATHRKLLVRGEENVEQPDRIWGEKCSRSDIVIDQGPTAPLPSGIPTYTVEIMNVCVTGCNISRIHLTCGWFSSATLVNPRVFKRLRYNDCLVNDGKPLVNGGTISFEYANTFLYPLKVSHVSCY